MDSSEKSSSSSSSDPIQGPNPIMTDEYNFKVTKTDDEKVNEVVLRLPSPNSSLSIEDVVFSIDHILESIFMKCDRQTLLSCRRVSRRWAAYGSKELQKTVVIKFTKVIHFGRRTSRTARFMSNSGETGSMGELITLMNSSAEFPSNSFDFRSEQKQHQDESSNMEIAQAFFNVHGASVKKILFRHDLYLEDLKHLLLNQAPNLRQLCLDRIKVEYKNSTEPEEQQPQQEHARRQKFLFDESCLNPKPILKNLKIFKCHFFSVLPDIFIQQILECSPNLVDVSVPIRHLHFLVQPTVRLPLIKKLAMDITSSNIDSYELFATLVQENKDLCEVRELHYCSAQNDGEAHDEAFSARLTNIVGNILKASSATCQKLVWGTEVENLKMPQMQQLKHLTLEYYLDLDRETVVNGLHGGVSLGYTFPNLKSLEVRCWIPFWMLDFPSANIFSDEDPTPATNVKTVTLRFLGPAGGMLLSSFRDMFPNAQIRSDKLNVGSYNDEGYEVEIEDVGSGD